MCPAVLPICGCFAFGQAQGLKPLQPVRHANPRQFGATEELASTNHVGNHRRATLHPESSLGDQLGQFLDDSDVAHLESISQLQLFGDHPTGEMLLVCRYVFPHCSTFGGSFQHKLGLLPRNSVKGGPSPPISWIFGSSIDPPNHLAPTATVPPIVPNL